MVVSGFGCSDIENCVSKRQTEVSVRGIEFRVCWGQGLLVWEVLSEWDVAEVQRINPKRRKKLHEYQENLHSLQMVCCIDSVIPLDDMRLQ